MDLNVYRTDSIKEREGVWKTIGGDSLFLVARANNPRYQASLAKFIKEFVPTGIAPEFGDTGVEKATIHAMAESLLLGWENITLDGEDLEYTFENSLKVLTDFPDLRETVAVISQNRNYYRPDDIAEK